MSACPTTDFGLWTLDFGLIPEWLSSLEHMRHALLCLAGADEREKRFAFEIEQILLGNARGVIQIAASQNARQVFANQGVVI